MSSSNSSSATLMSASLTTAHKYRPDVMRTLKQTQPTIHPNRIYRSDVMCGLKQNPNYEQHASMVDTIAKIHSDVSAKMVFGVGTNTANTASEIHDEAKKKATALLAKFMNGDRSITDDHRDGYIRTIMSNMTDNPAVYSYFLEYANNPDVGPIDEYLCCNTNKAILPILEKNPSLIKPEPLSMNNCTEVVEWLSLHPEHVDANALAKNSNDLAIQLLLRLKPVSELPWDDLCMYGRSPTVVQLFRHNPERIKMEFLVYTKSKEIFDEWVLPNLSALTNSQITAVLLSKNATTYDWAEWKQSKYKPVNGLELSFADEFARTVFRPNKMDRYLHKYGYDIHYGLDNTFDEDHAESDFGYGHGDEDDLTDDHFRRQLRELYRY
jgi:hypothetical protein